MTAEVMPSYEVPTDIKDEDSLMCYKLLKTIFVYIDTLVAVLTVPLVAITKQ